MREPEDSRLVLSSDLSKLSDILDSLSSNENSIKQAEAFILQKENFKTALAGILVLEIAGLHSEIQEPSTRLDDIEQYSRRNCLKFFEIPEERNEYTDTLVPNVFNNILFKLKQDKIVLESITRSHREGRPTSGRGPRDIILSNASVIATVLGLQTLGCMSFDVGNFGSQKFITVVSAKSGRCN